jgi:hypothetical protein
MMSNQNQFSSDLITDPVLTQTQHTFGFNQMVDLFAITNSAGFNGMQGLNTDYGGFTNDMDSGIYNKPALASNDGNVDHIARNAFISSQYKYMSNIRSQIN